MSAALLTMESVTALPDPQHDPPAITGITLEFEWQRTELQAALAGSCHREQPPTLVRGYRGNNHDNDQHDQEHHIHIPYFYPESVETGRLLGSGTFSAVHAVLLMPSLLFDKDKFRANKCKCKCKECKCKCNSNNSTGSNKSNNEEDTSVTDCSESVCGDDNDDLSLLLPASVIQDCDEGVGEGDDENAPESNKSRSLIQSSSLSQRNIQKSKSSSVTTGTGMAMAPQKGQTYALKRLHKQLSNSPEDQKLQRAGEKDLLLEAGILAHLPNHTNVIQLRALSVDFWKQPGSGFLIIDQLTETLHDRLQRWRRPPSVTAGPKIPFFKPHAKLIRRQQEQNSRIQQSALGIARAMEFLHKHKVIYRDLKPQNVGFDSAGTVQLFDFGLARVHCEGARRLTGFTGSARYMAPEVARCDAYSFPADVHAFAILLWEICTLEKAFCKTVNMQQLVQQVVQRHVRPSLRTVVSPILRELLQVSWHRDSDMRPSFALVVKQLELEGTFVRAL
jgi:serine/threonine protein kinase